MYSYAATVGMSNENHVEWFMYNKVWTTANQCTVHTILHFFLDRLLDFVPPLHHPAVDNYSFTARSVFK